MQIEDGKNPFSMTQTGGFNNGFTTFESSFAGGNTGMFGGG
jgi:hypothetical protein